MIGRVEILPTAWEDLKRIEDWYLLRFGADTALKVIDHILDAIERLEQFPDCGSATPDEWLNEQGYRIVICGRHVAIHKKIGNAIFVYHIADTRTEYKELFFT